MKGEVTVRQHNGVGGAYSSSTAMTAGRTRHSQSDLSDEKAILKADPAALRIGGRERSVGWLTGMENSAVHILPVSIGVASSNVRASLSYSL